MEMRAFGRTGMMVSVLGFGGAEIGYEGATQHEVDQLLNAALDAGLNVIDTATGYVDSEEKIGKAVSRRRKDYYLFTKCGISGGGPEHWTPKALQSHIDLSLLRLKTDHLDLLQLHSCPEEILRAGVVVEVVQKAKERGQTRFIGYSGDGPAAKYAIDCGAFDALQTSVNIVDQEAITLTLPLAAERNVTVIVKRPVANAAWKTGHKPQNAYHHEYWERLQKLDYPFLKGELDQAVSIALRFTLAQPGVSTAIVGTKNPARWKHNAELLNAGPLPASQIEAIRAHWMQFADPNWIGLT